MARKRPRGGPWVACNRAGARLRSAGHRLCCSCAARPSSSAGIYSSAFSRKARNRPETTCDRQLKARASGRAILAPVKTRPYTSKSCPTYGEPNFSPRRDLAKGREQPTWPAAWHRARRRSHRQSASSPFTRLRCAAARRAARPSTALPLPAPTAMEHKVVLERTDLLQKPIRKEVERRKIEADRRRNITTDGG